MEVAVPGVSRSRAAKPNAWRPLGSRELCADIFHVLVDQPGLTCAHSASLRSTTSAHVHLLYFSITSLQAENGLMSTAQHASPVATQCGAAALNARNALSCLEVKA